MPLRNMGVDGSGELHLSRFLANYPTPFWSEQCGAESDEYWEHRLMSPPTWRKPGRKVLTIPPPRQIPHGNDAPGAVPREHEPGGIDTGSDDENKGFIGCSDERDCSCRDESSRAQTCHISDAVVSAYGVKGSLHVVSARQRARRREETCLMTSDA